MEQHVPVLAKKVWRLVRVLYLMLRKNISKSKLLIDLTRMMKRGKITAGYKSLYNLMSHHHHHHNWATNFATPPGDEYEFSCTNSPAATNNHRPIFSPNYKHHSSCNQVHGTEDIDINAAVVKAMEMIHSEMASPALPGLGRSPVVRQLRVTDSPFPLSNEDVDSHVDEAAEQFISRFYNDLRRQNTSWAG